METTFEFSAGVFFSENENKRQRSVPFYARLYEENSDNSFIDTVTYIT